MKTNDDRSPSIHGFLSGLKLSETGRSQPFESRFSCRFRFFSGNQHFSRSQNFFSRGAVNLSPSTAQRRRWFEIVISSRDALKTYLQSSVFRTFDKLLQYGVLHFPISNDVSDFNPSLFDESRTIFRILNFTLTNLRTTFITMKIHYTRTMF